jgi:dUTP pyrophosphatase
LPTQINYQVIDPACRLTRGSEEAAGWDARAHLDMSIEIPPTQRCLVPLGIVLDLPQGWECQVRPRSGLALQYGITVLNSPGTIDSDFRGECGAILINHSSSPFMVHAGDRIAQLIFAPIAPIALHEVQEVSTSRRGEGGFGSTGKS